MFYRHKSLFYEQMLKKYQHLTTFLLAKKNYKYFIGYLYDSNITYVKSYDGQTNWMYFLIEDNDLLEKYNTIWDKVSADINKEFDSKRVYNKNYLKSKIKSHGDDFINFSDKKNSKLDANDTCLAIVTLDSVFKKV